MLKVVPVKDLRKLIVKFPIDDYTEFYKSDVSDRNTSILRRCRFVGLCLNPVESYLEIAESCLEFAESYLEFAESYLEIAVACLVYLLTLITFVCRTENSLSIIPRAVTVTVRYKHVGAGGFWHLNFVTRLHRCN